MATFTTRLGLRKPELTEQPSRTNDVLIPMDAIDAAVGAQVVTSSTRPTTTSALFRGKRIWETDTGCHLIEDTAGSTTGWVHPSIPGFSNGAPAVGADDLIDFGEGAVWRHRSVAEGSGYQTLVLLGDGSTYRREAKYKSTAAQAFANNTLTNVNFETAVYTSADVTPNAGFNQFTVKRAGVWRICAGLRWASGTNTGTPSGARVASLQLNGALIASVRRLGITAFHSLNLSTTVRLAVNDMVELIGLQDSGASRNTDPAAGNNLFTLTWLRG